jgi:uncharacterized protein
VHESILHNRADIAAICRRYGVHRLEVFGSAARGGDFDPLSSDADFLVEFAATNDADPLTQFFGLSEDLSRLLGRPVDLIERGALINPYLKEEIDKARELVYEA